MKEKKKEDEVTSISREKDLEIDMIQNKGEVQMKDEDEVLMHNEKSQKIRNEVQTKGADDQLIQEMTIDNTQKDLIKIVHVEIVDKAQNPCVLQLHLWSFKSVFH